jgi:hypothetical protein
MLALLILGSLKFLFVKETFDFNSHVVRRIWFPLCHAASTGKNHPYSKQNLFPIAQIQQVSFSLQLPKTFFACTFLLSCENDLSRNF